MGLPGFAFACPHDTRKREERTGVDSRRGNLVPGWAFSEAVGREIMLLLRESVSLHLNCKWVRLKRTVSCGPRRCAHTGGLHCVTGRGLPAERSKRLTCPSRRHPRQEMCCQTPSCLLCAARGSSREVQQKGLCVLRLPFAQWGQ